MNKALHGLPAITVHCIHIGSIILKYFAVRFICYKLLGETVNRYFLYYLSTRCILSDHLVLIGLFDPDFATANQSVEKMHTLLIP